VKLSLDLFVVTVRDPS